jgi:hypothetical protein
MDINQDMIRRAMDEMDKRLLKRGQNIWESACELSRTNIAFEILDAAINGGGESSQLNIKGDMHVDI